MAGSVSGRTDQWQTLVDWSTVASAATAVGTLVLAVATFSVVRSGRGVAQATEQALLAGIRPLVLPSNLDDPDQKVSFMDEHWVHVGGGRASVEVTTNAVYLVMSIRNVGNGLAVLDRWDLSVRRLAADDPAEANRRSPGSRSPRSSEFRRLDKRYLYTGGRTGLLAGRLARPVRGRCSRRPVRRFSTGVPWPSTCCTGTSWVGSGRSAASPSAPSVRTSGWPLSAGTTTSTGRAPADPGERLSSRMASMEKHEAFLAEPAT